MTIKILPNDIIEIEGVKIAISFLKQILNKPPKGVFSFVRDGDTIMITRHEESKPL